MEKAKGHIYGIHKYTVRYQTKDDRLNHGRSYDNYEDALEFFNAVKVFHREFEKPLWVYLQENFYSPDNRMIGETKLIYYNNIEGDPKNTVDNE